MPKKYRKKPVVIEALQVKFGYTNISEISDFIGESFVDTYHGKMPYIKTLEGDMYISDGDYIIKGVQGEFYPCKPDIFEATYEDASKGDLSAGLIYALCQIYGFSVNDAKVLLEYPVSKGVLLTNLELRATGHLKKPIIRIDVENEAEIDKIIDRIGKSIEKEIKANSAIN